MFYIISMVNLSNYVLRDPFQYNIVWVEPVDGGSGGAGL